MFENMFTGVLVAVAGPVVFLMYGYTAFEHGEAGRRNCGYLAIISVMAGVGLYLFAAGRLGVDIGFGSKTAKKTWKPTHIAGTPLEDFNRN